MSKPITARVLRGTAYERPNSIEDIRKLLLPVDEILESLMKDRGCEEGCGCEVCSLYATMQDAYLGAFKLESQKEKQRPTCCCGRGPETRHGRECREAWSEWGRNFGEEIGF